MSYLVTLRRRVSAELHHVDGDQEVGRGQQVVGLLRLGGPLGRRPVGCRPRGVLGGVRAAAVWTVHRMTARPQPSAEEGRARRAQRQHRPFP